MAIRNTTVDVTVKVDAPNRKIRLLWPDNQSAEFHYVWLRHHARCPEGLPNDTSIKIDLIPDDPASLVINRCSIKGECLEIEWGDQELKTLHPIPALASMQYGRDSRQNRKPVPIFWPQDNNHPIPCYPLRICMIQRPSSRSGYPSETLGLSELKMCRFIQAPLQMWLNASALCIETTMVKYLMSKAMPIWHWVPIPVSILGLTQMKAIDTPHRESPAFIASRPLPTVVVPASW